MACSSCLIACVVASSQTDGAVENAEALEIRKLQEEVKKMREERKLRRLRQQVLSLKHQVCISVSCPTRVCVLCLSVCMF